MAGKGSYSLISDDDRQSTASNKLLAIARYAALITIFCAFGIVLYRLGETSGRNSARACFEQITYHSPVADSVDLSYHESYFDVPLFTDSIYVRQPSTEVDAAWNEIAYKPGGIITVPLADMLASGYSADHARLPDSEGGGYLVGIEVFHLLHCVNFLRKASFLNIDYYRSPSTNAHHASGPFSDPENMIRPHLNHCVEVLRRKLMCRADAGMYAHKHVRNFTRLLPAFEHPDKCANFESLREEAMKRQLKGKLNDEPLPGDYIWDEPSPRDYLEGKVEGWTTDGFYVGGDGL